VPEIAPLALGRSALLSDIRISAVFSAVLPKCFREAVTVDHHFDRLLEPFLTIFSEKLRI
jgi:hypothetical protein